MNVEVEVKKLGGVWVPEGSRSDVERGMTEQIARRKVQELLVRRMEWTQLIAWPSASGVRCETGARGRVADSGRVGR
jgi:hypothetical protein